VTVSPHNVQVTSVPPEAYPRVIYDATLTAFGIGVRYPLAVGCYRLKRDEAVRFGSLSGCSSTASIRVKAVVLALMPMASLRMATQGWVWAAATASGHIDSPIHHEETAPAGSEAQWRATLRTLLTAAYVSLTRLGEAGCDAWAWPG
jgi:hypothetical protein